MKFSSKLNKYSKNLIKSNLINIRIIRIIAKNSINFDLLSKSEGKLTTNLRNIFKKLGEN